ncbi:D-xylose-binding periplasmic protein precursor [Serratia fonticola]|uniref:D-xylose-binding periplasmic protein n=1 Tax=Serratia fonticola TaxID=47917 RepID=A0A4U9VHV1_SERFO|nr:D-xylose-binding periplasmic protein precursor [Serratia fonticola]
MFVQSANGNEETQMAQIENMINRGVDVLVIIPYNGQVLSNVIREAKREGIKVLAYDRMINNADIDFYISFDNEKVGEMQAESLVQRVPQGNYFLMGGSPVDNNAKLFRKGQMTVLQPLNRQRQDQSGGRSVGRRLAAGKRAEDYGKRSDGQQ